MNTVSERIFEIKEGDRKTVEITFGVLEMDDTILYHDGMEEAKAGQLFTENVLVLGLIGSGAYLMTPFGWFGWPVLSIFYIGASIATLTFALRKHLCTHCWYYGKRWRCGWSGECEAGLFFIIDTGLNCYHIEEDLCLSKISCLFLAHLAGFRSC